MPAFLKPTAVSANPGQLSPAIPLRLPPLVLGVKTYLLLDDTYFDNEVGEDCISDEVVRAQVNCTDQQQLKQHQRHLIAIQHQRVKHVLLV